MENKNQPTATPNLVEPLVMCGDMHFICYFGGPEWLPACFRWQVWFYVPGSNSLFQKESESQSLKQKPKGLYDRMCYKVQELMYGPPRYFSGLWPLSNNLLLLEVEDDNSQQDQIEPELLKMQIKSKIISIKKSFAGLPAEVDFGGRLRWLGFPMRGSRYV